MLSPAPLAAPSKLPERIFRRTVHSARRHPVVKSSWECRQSGLQKSSHPTVVFAARGAFDSGANIHAPRTDARDRLGHVFRAKAAGKNNPLPVACRYTPIEWLTRSRPI